MTKDLKIYQPTQNRLANIDVPLFQMGECIQHKKPVLQHLGKKRWKARQHLRKLRVPMIEKFRETDTLPEPEMLDGEYVAFTGTLASMTHRDAAALVEKHGGVAHQNVTQSTTLLVIGEEGWPLEEDGRPSLKLLAAQNLMERGHPLRLISESEWLTALGLESQSRLQQLYTPAMLSQMLHVSVHDIRRWERMRLIRPVHRIMRLPYFEFKDVAAARRIADLVASGISPEHLARSLEQLKSVIPNLDQPLSQLHILAQGGQILYRDGGGWLEPRTGQRHLPFPESVAENDTAAEDLESERQILPLSGAPLRSSPAHPAEDYFERGCQLAEQNRLSEAVEAFRAAIIERPSASEYHFQLADVLYRLGHLHAAIERYYVAVENDHNFIEAWTQLGCVLLEARHLEAAQEAFQIALDRHPDFPDAHFHLAQVLEELGDHHAARSHWQAYLTFDVCGPWADTARQHLENADSCHES